MNEFQLVTTEKFGDLDCNFYRNNNDLLLTREQIGSALEYVNPQKAIDNIHNRHKERMDKFSVTHKLRGTDGKIYMTNMYNTKGVMEICRWSRQPKANDFIDFTWGIMDNLFFKESTNYTKQQLDYSPIMVEIASLKNEIQSIKYLTTRQQPISQYSKWKKKTNHKMKLLADYFEETQLTILRNLYIELEDTYDIDLNEYKSDYCFDMGLDNCSQFDVIENNKKLRDMFDLLVNALLEKYGLISKIEENTKRKTIFN